MGRASLVSGLVLLALTNSASAFQIVNVKVTVLKMDAQCYNVAGTSGYVTARINGRDVPFANGKIEIRAGGKTLGETTTRSNGYYYFTTNLGERLIGDRTYDCDAVVVTSGYRGNARTTLKVRKALAYATMSLGGTPWAGQVLAVDFYLRSSSAPVANQWIDTGIGQGRTDDKGKLTVFFRPKKGLNNFIFKYSGTDYVSKYQTQFQIKGI